MKTMKFAVPPGSWKAEVMKWDTHEWAPVETSNFCYQDHQAGNQVESCFLYVDSETKALQFSAVKLVKTSTQSVA